MKENYEISKNILPLGSEAYKLYLDHLGPEDISSHNSRTLTAIFTKRISISPESYEESNKIMKSFKIPWPWRLEP